MSKIGQVAEHGKRDAFHAACVAAKYVGEGKPKPGQNVRFEDNRCLTVYASTKSERHGIIDPFVSAAEIADGDTAFWVLLIPDATADLNHYFTVSIPGLAVFSSPPATVEEDEVLNDDDDRDDSCRGCY